MTSCQVKQYIVSFSHVSHSDAGRDLKEKGTARKPRELNLFWAEGGRAALQSHWCSPSLCIRGRVGQYLQQVCSCNPQELCRREGTYQQILFCRRQVVISSQKTLSRTWCYTCLRPALRLWFCGAHSDITLVKSKVSARVSVWNLTAEPAAA